MYFRQRQLCLPEQFFCFGLFKHLVNIPLQHDQKGGHWVAFEIQPLSTANNRGCKSFLRTVMTRINYQLYTI